MKIRLLILVGILACCHQVTRAEEPKLIRVVLPIYVPFAAYYVNGSFTKAAPVGDEWFQSLKECNESMQRAALAVLEGGKVPDGGSIKTVCVPVPSMDVRS